MGNIITAVSQWKERDPSSKSVRAIQVPVTSGRGPPCWKPAVPTTEPEPSSSAPAGRARTRPLRRAPQPRLLARKCARAPARWRLRRSRCGLSAACPACCSSSPSATFCRAMDQDLNPQRNFIINMTCRFCWQLPETDYECTNSTSCMTVACPRQRYLANCTVRDHIHCLGNRTFPKLLYCNWTGGYKWSTALALSITLGGFGADRFYLGQWREGLGKLFSFGGLGIWTLIDVLLIGVGYVGPADGSLYI
ncbi:TM2 domain-containing protein 3 isoform X4 [Cricetulus griseus]|uniref:TM2 domain-containing protein 3 n=1 Tax=Cricetulus griseus TaxID=10029 RepID=A0A9J7GWL4_CRIGR|nr:TM2 domain-containing protein 3 isoform X4 [Cricetulus griseus]